MSKKTVLSAKIDYLINYAKQEYSKSKGLHLNSADWKSFVTIGTPQYYSFIINGTIKFYTKSKISAERYDQLLKLVDFKKLEAPLLLLFLTGHDDRTITEFISLLLSHGEAKIFCPCEAFCLEKNTIIDLVDGRSISIQDLYNEHISGIEHYVYSIDENKNPTVNKVKKIWISGKSKNLIKVTLDNDKYIITTPEHYYIKRDGSSAMAKDLSINDSLMPIYFTEDKSGYKHVKLNGNKYQYKNKSVHRLVAEKYISDKKYEKNTVIHHKDFDKMNNSPSNLEYMDKVEHIKYHAKYINKNRDRINTGYRNWLQYMKDNYPEVLKEIKGRGGYSTHKKHPEQYNYFLSKGIEFAKNNREYYSNLMKLNWIKNRQIMCQKLSDRWKNNENYRETIISSLKAAWTDDRRKNQAEKIKTINKIVNKKTNSTNYHKISVKIGNIFNTITEVLNLGLTLDESNFELIRSKNKKFNYTLVFNTFEECINAYHAYNNNTKDLINSILEYNHKIVNIENIKLDVAENVYDIEIENDHNFYVNAGVVLHNSFWGPHYNLTKIKSAYGPGEIRPPDKRDPNRQNLVCKHLWVILDSYSKLVNSFTVGLLPYYKRLFGLTSPTGIERLQKTLGEAGFKKVIEQAIIDLNKINNAQLTSKFKQLTDGKLNEVMKPKENIEPVPEFETIDKSKPEEKVEEPKPTIPKITKEPVKREVQKEPEVKPEETPEDKEITPNDMEKLVDEEKKNEELL